MGTFRVKIKKSNFNEVQLVPIVKGSELFML